MGHDAQSTARAGRGDQCTSADAAGFPIAPLLFTADEVAAGAIDHAIRFILPNDRIRKRRLRAPGDPRDGAAGGPAPTRRPTASTSGCAPTTRSTTLPTEGARVVARAMQKYGMFLADGGNIALTAQSDRFTTAKWSGLIDSYVAGGAPAVRLRDGRRWAADPADLRLRAQ